MNRGAVRTVLCLAALLLGIAAVGASFAAAQEPTTMRVLYTTLENPCAIAVQPVTGDLFVADSARGRVLRGDASGKPGSIVIDGFPTETFGDGPTYNIGPVGLAFLDEHTLVVGGGGRPYGQETVGVYTVPPRGTKIRADEVKLRLGPLAASEITASGEGDFHGIATTATAVFVASNGDDTKGWILRSAIRGGVPAPLSPWIKSKPATETDSPSALAIDPTGRLAVALMGELGAAPDSQIAFFDVTDGRLLDSAVTGLYDVVGLAYSPRTGSLYAADFSWHDPSRGGVFRLDLLTDAGSLRVDPVRIGSFDRGVDKPSALAFGRDGALYVTMFGTAAEGLDARAGKVLKFDGDL